MTCRASHVILMCLVACEYGRAPNLTSSEHEEPQALTDSLEQDSAELTVCEDDPATLSALSFSEEQQLTELSRPQAYALCQEAGRNIDLCAVAARNQGSARRCEATLATCREQAPGPQTDCRDARFDFPEPCTATVGDYLSCVKAWNGELSCTFDTIGSDTAPEACLPLLQKCPYLESEFGRAADVVLHCDKATSPARVDDNDDIYGLDGCRPVPSRMVTLGDSIAACFGVLESRGERCAPNLIAQYLREHYAPELSYESHAVPGAITADLLAQAMKVTPGPGHVLVWAFAGGNDMARCQQPSMDKVRACVDNLLATLPARWSAVFAYFSDPQLFPDGVTFLMNTQYGLWDQCNHPLGPARVPFAEEQVRRVNQTVLITPAIERSDTIAIDHFPDWLGHAQSADVRGCPHCYSDDNSPWLFDGTHPNVKGNQHIADKWKVAADLLYGSCM